MSHQPFETLIYQDVPRTTQQEAELQLHLKDCPQCSRNEKAWMDVRCQLAAAPMARPTPGFTKRWEAKFAVERARQQERQIWLTILIIVGSLLLILALIGLIISLNATPASLLAGAIAAFVNFSNWLVQAQQTVSQLLAHTPTWVWWGLGALVLVWFSVVSLTGAFAFCRATRLCNFNRGVQS